jgi:NodT family efflux transporter outer membrane factor (OMF) lipoprotein
MNPLTTRRRLPQWAHLFVLSPLVVAMIGCASGPDYVHPESPSVTKLVTVAPPASTAASPVIHGGSQQFANAPVPGEWWKELQSDKLNRLIAQALVASPSLAAAQATLRQARHNYAASSGATELPQVNAKLGAQRLGANNAAAGLPDGERTYDLYNATVAVSYDLDLAGGNRRALEALTAQADYQSYQLEGSRLTLAANLVLTAITQAQLAAQIDATNNLLQGQAEQIAITRKRIELGAGTQLEVLALQVQMEQTQAGLHGIHNKKEQTRHLLALLAGLAPGENGLPEFKLADFALPGTLPVSIPSEWVRRRPDVRASEALLQTASAQYGVAVAKLYPQLTLTANLGSQALTTASLFGAGSLIWSLGGQLVQPLFNPGLRANTKALEAGLDAAKANYQQTVLQSLRNVADVLRTIESDALVQQSLESANASAAKALKLVERQYALGSASYLQLLLSQQQAQQAHINTLEVRARRLSNTVTLYQAMGGGALVPS